MLQQQQIHEYDIVAPMIQSVQNVQSDENLKVAYLSDIHLEFELYPYELPKADVLILAGDVMASSNKGNFDENYVKFINKTSENYEYGILMVLGNHDYWNLSLRSAHDEFRKVLSHNVRLLQNDYVVIRGRKFHGTTLWTSLNNMNPLTQLVCRNGMNDFRKVYDLIPATWYKEHIDAVKYIENNVNRWDVVITHHLPSMHSIDPVYRNSGDINYAYASDLDDLIVDLEPSYWIHGHTHSSKNYVLGNTTILCNPKGYYNENKNFNPSAYFEV